MFPDYLEDLSHALVHVAQFRRYGPRAMLALLMDRLSHSAEGRAHYDASSYEFEALDFERQLVEATGGRYCEESRFPERALKSEFRLASWQCHPYGPWLASIFAALSSN